MVQKEVRRFQVAVDDPERVGLGESFARLQKAPDCVVDRQRAALLEDAREIDAIEVFHDHVGLAAFERSHVEYARYVLARKRSSGAGFPKETLDGVGIARGLHSHELNRHTLRELKMVRREDDSHASRAKDVIDPILAHDDLPGRGEVRIRRIRGGRGRRLPPGAWSHAAWLIVTWHDSDPAKRVGARLRGADDRG